MSSYLIIEMNEIIIAVTNIFAYFFLFFVK